MKILSVNCGKARPYGSALGRTGIFKTPVAGPVAIHALGIGDDEVSDLSVHGGTDQAVYLYGQPDYAFWEAELGRRLAPGLFGENLTVSGLESQAVMIGDRFRIGDVLIEASAPRNPCNTFALVMDDRMWVRRFHAAQRPGVYARVLVPGTIAAGDAVALVPFAGEKVPVTALTEDYKKPAPERMRWLLKAPIHKDLRAQYERALAALEAEQAQQQQ